MSYILDALRKSDRDRQQGRIPDLGQQFPLIHQPRRKKVPVFVWFSLGLILNALVLAALFRPSIMPFISDLATETTTNNLVSPSSAKSQTEQPSVEEAKEPAMNPPVAQKSEPEPEFAPKTEPASTPDPEGAVLANNPAQPMVIVPSWDAAPDIQGRNATVPDAAFSASDTKGRVLHLIELPRSFQRDIPTLIFNSHLYASNPAARRVMINDNYLRPGDRFSGILVEQITVDGVVLSFNGQRFRVGVVRNWISPN